MSWTHEEIKYYYYNDSAGTKHKFGTYFWEERGR